MTIRSGRPQVGEGRESVLEKVDIGGHGRGEGLKECPILCASFTDGP